MALAGCVVILSGFWGCQNADRGVKVMVEGDGQFPKSLVGRWRAEENGWEFVFRPDGTISSAVIDNGRIRVTPGKKVAVTRLEEAGKAVYKLGQWTVQYSPNNRELAVRVVVEHFRIGTNSQGLQGHSTDWFVGPVSEDSQSWVAERFTFPKHILLGPEPTEFPFDPNDNPIETLIFRKQ